MELQGKNLLELKDEIINAFRPIEQLFKVMDTSSVEVYGELTHTFSEIGTTLCQNFRHKLDAILAQQKEGGSHGHE
jgi:hypothetical protein